MSNIIREIFVEDHVRVLRSIEETLRDLNGRDFKFCISQAQWRVKIFVFFKKCFVLSASFIFHFPSGTEYLGDFLSFSFFTES